MKYMPTKLIGLRWSDLVMIPSLQTASILTREARRGTPWEGPRGDATRSRPRRIKATATDRPQVLPECARRRAGNGRGDSAVAGPGFTRSGNARARLFGGDAAAVSNLPADDRQGS